MTKLVENPSPGIKQDLTGMSFAYLTVIRKCGIDKHSQVVWLCRCHCGKNTKAITTTLKSGKKISCGCMHYRGGSSTYNWTGCGEISGSYLYSLRTNANNRGMAFDVTPDYLWSLFLRQDRICALSGLPLCFGRQQTASLDRIDARHGYVEDNLQWVHKHINLMRNHFPVEYFIEMCRIVDCHQKEKGK
jgi:hypothetical protein